MTISAQARKKNPARPSHWQMRAVNHEVAVKEKAVLISQPVAKLSAAQVATLYHERWEIELGFRDIKSAQPLRNKKVALVYKELQGLLPGYHLIR